MPATSESEISFSSSSSRLSKMPQPNSSAFFAAPSALGGLFLLVFNHQPIAHPPRRRRRDVAHRQIVLARRQAHRHRAVGLLGQGGLQEETQISRAALIQNLHALDSAQGIACTWSASSNSSETSAVASGSSSGASSSPSSVPASASP